ncbi:MAG: hydroxyacylglutathione hydrolase [Myxococcales bacterium]|nr:hydroxyacylglutathione hydrolase [Myxococcales bacterium]
MNLQHVVSEPSAPFTIRGGALEVHQLLAWTDNLIWLLVSPARGEAAIVDGPEARAALERCAALGVRLTTVINTHTHRDHIGVNLDLARRGLLSGMRVVGPALAAGDVPGLTDPVDDGDRVDLWGTPAEVLRTEGHMNGHVSYVVADVLFCGDTLFGGGCGYLFDGPPAKMHESLTRLAALPGETRVCCAHEYTQDNLRFALSVEPDNAELMARIRDVWAVRERGGSTVPSTVALERATNPFLRPRSPTLQARVREAMPDRALDSDCAVFTATRALKDRKDYRRLADPVLAPSD